MQRLGLVDLGSNTARLVVYAYEPGTWFRLEDEIREPIRLAEGLIRHGHLSDAAIGRAEAALKLFADYRTGSDLELAPFDVFGTSALRDAGDRERLSVPDGLRLRVLSGEEEAECGVRAVANSFAQRDAWVMDLGGGSAQVSRMEERLCVDGQAYPLGAVRLTETFLGHDPPKNSEIKRLKATVEQHLGPIAARMAEDDLPLVAMGGTIRNLARAVQKDCKYPLNLLHGYFLPLRELDELISELCSLKAAQRGTVPGIHRDRADIILAGALVFQWLLHASGRDGLWISGQGLREGAFYERFLPAPHHLVPDVRAFARRNVSAYYRQLSRLHPDRQDQYPGHIGHVRHLARRLFDSLQPLHELGEDAAELLDTAAELHDLGSTIDYYRHHKHGAYLLGSAPLVGFDHREQTLILLMVRYHHKGSPRMGPLQSLMHAGDKRLLRMLTTCLRLAETLERSRAGRVSDVRAQIDDKTVTLELDAREEPSVELWETRNQSSLFESAFGRQLELRTRRP